MEYISKEAMLKVVKKLVGDDAFGGPRIQMALESMPKWDTINVVHCEDCPHAQEVPGVFGFSLYCRHWEMDVPIDGFCHQGY